MAASRDVEMESLNLDGYSCKLTFYRKRIKLWCHFTAAEREMNV